VAFPWAKPTYVAGGGIAMNEEVKQKELERRLEQATAADSPAALDVEATAWREGWLAWGDLLEAGDAREMNNLDRLLDIPNAVAVPKVVEVKAVVRKNSTPFREKWKAYFPSVSATLVVSLLLAIGVWKYWPATNSPPKERLVPIADADLAWNDAWDSRVTSLREQMALAQYDSASLGSSFDSVRLQVENLSREIEQNPL
jgi:hypothetical protein